MINYIASLYFGKRRNELVQQCLDEDPYYLLKSHMLAFHKYEMPYIHKVTFVVNPSENIEIDEKAIEVLEEYKQICRNKDILFEILYCPDNKHISYGAWNYAIMNGLNDEKTNYFFLLEDDYVPCADNFYNPYLERSANNIAHVCQLWQPGKPKPSAPHIKLPGRAGMTGGLLNANASRDVFKKHGTCFLLEVTSEYSQLISSKKTDDITKKYILSGVAQQKFLRLYEHEGYDITDTGPDNCQLFLTTRGIRVYGQGNPATIEPIYEYKIIDKTLFQ